MAEVSTWTAIRRDGATYHDGNATYADLCADDQLDALVLQRGPSCVVVKPPKDARPFFLRRWRATVPLDGSPAEPTEYAACVGWERDGAQSLAWLMWDGSVVLCDKADLDDVSR